MKNEYKITEGDVVFIETMSSDIFTEESRSEELEFYFRDCLIEDEQKNVKIEIFDWEIKITGILPNRKKMTISCRDVSDDKKFQLFIKRFHDDFLKKLRNRKNKVDCQNEMERICGDKLNYLLVKDEYDKYLFYEKILKKVNKISYQARVAKIKQLKRIMNEMADKLGIDEKTVEDYKDYILRGCKDMFGDDGKNKK